MDNYNANAMTLPDGWLVARLDGRAFHTRVKQWQLAEPCDVDFREAIRVAIEHVMRNAGLRPLLAYDQSDEITLVFAPANQVFNRRLLKWASVLPSEFTAAFTLAFAARHVDVPLVQYPPAFDAHLFVYRTMPEVLDNLRQRHDDAVRNGVNAIAYWYQKAMVHNGRKRKAHNALKGLGQRERIAMLDEKQPGWRHRWPRFIYGQFSYWETVQMVNEMGKYTRQVVQTAVHERFPAEWLEDYLTDMTQHHNGG